MTPRSEQFAQFADTLAASIERGDPQTYEKFKERNPGTTISQSDFQEAVLLAEHRAAQSWGLIKPERRLSRQTFESLSSDAQSLFISEGGTVFDPPPPSEADKRKETMTWPNGATITRGQYESFTPTQLEAFLQQQATA